MKRNISIQIRAVLLLAVFGLNTVVGFACAIGLDMGFNSTHHHDEEATEVHIHADGKKHLHKKKTHQDNKPHQHDQDKTNHNSKEGKDNCCNDQVLKFEQTDKSVPHSLNIVHPLFLIAFFDVFHDVALPYFDIVKDIKRFVRNYHPPIADIRISIQSFQI